MNILNLNIDGFYLDKTVRKKIKLARYVKDKENWIDVISPCNDISEEIKFYLPKEMK